MSIQNDRRSWTVLAVALLLLDVSLTFSNIWPTPAVGWRGELSVEVAACLLGMAIAARFGAPGGPEARGALSRPLLRILAALWVLLVIGRYAAVTAPALYGRDINLFWDVRHVSAVAAMLARVASPGLVLLAVAVAVLVPLLLYAVLRWALGRVSDAMSRPRVGRVLGLVATLVVLWFIGQRLDGRFPVVPRFSTPVTAVYARQARLLVGELTARRLKTLGPIPIVDSDLSRVSGADVFLIFIESYGAVTYDRPAFAEYLAPARAKLDADIHLSGRDVVSAYVESPTFGGNSWLAHISLLSGVEVRDEDANVVLMAQKRDTLATTFARHGYRTVALMPGLQQSWPEGSFYGFNEIYGTRRLDYHGPDFGWWSLTDQFALARFDKLEVAARARAPLFVFFPTISTHTPFSPTPPYQPDWERMLTKDPYDAAVLDAAWADTPDWLNLGPSYVRAVAYAFASLGGYLRLRADRDVVMILLGDHQPPAAVTGEGARWDVPVHVIASRKQILDRLLAHAFRPGLAPAGPAISRMHELLPVLLGAFGDGERSGHEKQQR